MTDRSAIARESVRAAFQVRRSLVIAREQPLNPFDVSQALGIDVWFTDAPSLEGLFARTDDARIVLPCLSHRPLGRLCFSCAHELGHAQLGHGNRIDEYVERPSSRTDPEEFAADVFASNLLMPRPAVLGAFQVRGTAPDTASDLELLTIAFELCVGLETLVKHLHWGLDLIDRVLMQRLVKVTPKAVRSQAFGAKAPKVVIPIDRAWRSTAVDIEVGHAIAIPSGSAARTTLSSQFDCMEMGREWDLLVAKSPGIATLARDGGSVALRVARAAFIGPWRYRYLADEEAA